MTKNSYAQAGGRVSIKGKSYKKRVGSRREVWNEPAYATNYGKDGLKKESNDLAALYKKHLIEFNVKFQQFKRKNK